jgi:Cu(I)/Ag(I) efflux system membrane fusion protein
VRKDQPLATFYSREMLTPQQGYIYALESMERVTGDKMPEGLRTADEKTIELARAQLRQAEDALEALGMDRVQMAQLARSRQTAAEVVLRAPVAGYVVERNAAPGQRFEKFTELYRVVDLGHVWIIADLYERDADRVSAGQAVRVTAESGKRIEASVSSAPPQYDPGSRTFRVRLEADNPDGALRPDMLVDVELSVDLPPGLSIPAEALLDSGMKKSVFVARGNGYYEPRAVQVGWRTSDRVQVLDGLAEGDQIALSGQFLLDADSRLRSTPAAVAASPSVTDPVCGMTIDPAAASSSVEYRGKRYYFCSTSCRRTFDADPAGTIAHAH